MAHVLEISFDDLSDTTPTWTDVTQWFVEGFCQRGSAVTDLDEPEAGTATFVLDNRDRRFEPLYAAGQCLHAWSAFPGRSSLYSVSPRPN